MVIPSLIARAVGGERPLTVWGDGSPVRDFIHARDVARGMMLAVERGFNQPVNLGSGTGVRIKDVAETVARLMNVELVWDTTKPAGDAKRLMSSTRAESIGFKPEVALADGIAETLEWYRAHRADANLRYNAFTDKTYAAS
jgi:GDP-L-fucose synthase